MRVRSKGSIRASGGSFLMRAMLPVDSRYGPAISMRGPGRLRVHLATPAKQFVEIPAHIADRGDAVQNEESECGPACFGQMHVEVDEPRHEEAVRSIDGGCSVGHHYGGSRADRGDPLTPNEHGLRSQRWRPVSHDDGDVANGK